MFVNVSGLKIFRRGGGFMLSVDLCDCFMRYPLHYSVSAGYHHYRYSYVIITSVDIN